MPNLISPAYLANLEAICAAAEKQAKHFEGPQSDHHLGCGYCSTKCPGQPDWSFARTGFPRLLSAYRELQDQHDALLLTLQLTRDKARLGGHVDA